MTDLHGNEPIVFDFDAAGQLVTAARGAASAIRSEKGARSRAVTTAKEQFKGYYSQLFATNAQTAAGDGDQLIAALDGLATITNNLIAAAHSENARRKTARDWYEKRAHRSTLDKIGDSLFGEDSPPEGPKPPPAHALPPIPQPQPRHIGGHGSSGGTSSAIPDHLTSFATTSAASNHRIDPHQSKVASLVHTFNANTKWGQLEAQPLLAAFLAWNKANDNDVRWARTLAAAFKAAGGDGGLVTLSNSSLGAALKAAGVNATRQDLAISMPQTKGFSVTTGYSLDPVNTATGNFIESETDLAFAGAAELALTRMYNSFSAEEGAFGHGWSSLAEAGLAFDEEKASLTLADGRVVVFPRLGEGWDQPVSDALWLVTLEDGSHRITGNDGSWWACSAAGRMTGFGTGPGTSVTLTHDDDGHLVEISHERGRAITLTWTGGRISAATTSDGRTASYTYDDAGHLLSVTAPGADRTYRWDTEAHLITAVIDADGVVEAENTYDEQRRVVTQLTPHGRHVRFSYLPGRVTVIDDPDGSNSNTWIADPWGRLVGVIDSDDNRQSMSYDAHGNLVVITERDGATTVHEYDDRSRRTRTVTPSGADLQFGYDELDRVTTVVTEAGAVTTYAYEGDERNPSTITDPEGGVTTLTWARGLMRSISGPTGVTVTFEHDGHGNLVATTDADGNTARLEYDDAGRVSAAVTPLGHRTTYTYDAAGNLSERTDPDGAVWRYEHSAARRLEAVIDPLGNRTTIEHDDSGEATLTTDPLGRSLLRTYDTFGNLSSITLPDGRRWGYGHDSLSRPTTVTSPDGATWTTTYDDNGIPVGGVDPTGVSVDLSLDLHQRTLTASTAMGSSALAVDPLGRPVRGTDLDGSEQVCVYDRCGRLVESVDGEGGLTRFRHDAAGHLLEIVSPSGATRRYEHDRCGRVSAVVDETGFRTTFDYDADGRVVRMTLPTGEVAETDYDACGRVIARRVPGIGRTTAAYDAAGRVTEITGPVNGTRRFDYDAVGQLVGATAGNGGTTRYEYDALGRVIATTDPVGGVTRRQFDSLGNVVAETDPLGRTKRAGYDAAGRRTWFESADGHRTEWTYDAAGHVATITVDGAVQSSYQRDVRARRLTIVDHSDASRGACTHQLTWDRCGRLVSRSRDARTISWAYDVDGRRASMTTPDGSTTSYERDAAGRLTSVEHPLLGRATFRHDASGRRIATTAGDLMQSWDYRDGFLSAHALTTADGVSRTQIERDDEGRISSITDEGGTTQFSYDDACQMIAALQDGTTTTWQYDAAGRLVAETVDGASTDYTYDVAGQLLSTTSPGRLVSYEYDQAGRRTAVTADGRTTTYTWDARGWLAGIAGDLEIALHVDALGELARIDDTDLFHDTGSGTHDLVQLGGTSIVSLEALLGLGGAWAASGWRAARDTSARDPWGLPQSAATGTLPAGVSISTGGEVVIAGLEWMNARVYDPASRGFLSRDPLEPITGAGWAGNPYSYAGNDPLHALDPLGLRPATDADLKAWTDAHKGWVANNWEYLAAGAMIVAGGALMLTGVGGPAGLALVSMGADAAIQKATTGSVNWGEVAVTGVLTVVTAGAGGALVDAAERGTSQTAAWLASHPRIAEGVAGAVTNDVSTAAQNLMEGKPVYYGLGTASISGFAGGAAGFTGENASITRVMTTKMAAGTGGAMLQTTLNGGNPLDPKTFAGELTSGVVNSASGGVDHLADGVRNPPPLPGHPTPDHVPASRPEKVVLTTHTLVLDATTQAAWAGHSDHPSGNWFRDTSE